MLKHKWHILSFAGEMSYFRLTLIKRLIIGNLPVFLSMTVRIKKVLMTHSFKFVSWDYPVTQRGVSKIHFQVFFYLKNLLLKIDFHYIIIIDRLNIWIHVTVICGPIQGVAFIHSSSLKWAIRGFYHHIIFCLYTRWNFPTRYIYFLAFNEVGLYKLIEYISLQWYWNQ